MIEGIKKIFDFGKSTDFATLMKNGAQIIHVRTPGEFSSGHIHGSVNIPLGDLKEQLKKIKKDKPVITCCASGMRSANAKSILLAHGFSEVYNGGGWSSLENKIK